ncbi:hypothetical protein ACLB2K_059784 [Fragaria x ananassa]
MVFNFRGHFCAVKSRDLDIGENPNWVKQVFFSEVDLGQARGKFARVCVEVDLGKPLKPFVEVESVAYSVIYEGISLIFFECGCFGHSKDKCPIIVSPTVNPSSGDPNCSFATSNSAGNVEMTNEMEARNETPSVIKEDMGPWMLMNYRNKKKASKHGGTVKSPIKGSRFYVLHDEIAIATNEAGTIVVSSKNPPAPPIIKLWTSFQDKQKKMQAPSTSKAIPSATGISKLPTMNASPGKKILFLDSSCFVEKVFTDNSNLTVDENLSSYLEEEMVNA